MRMTPRALLGGATGAPTGSVPKILCQRFPCLCNACMQTQPPHDAQVDSACKASWASHHARSYLSGLVAAHSLGMNRTFVRGLRALRLVLLNSSWQRQSEALQGAFVFGEDEAEESMEALKRPAQLGWDDSEVIHGRCCLPLSVFSGEIKEAQHLPISASSRGRFMPRGVVLWHCVVISW